MENLDGDSSKSPAAEAGETGQAAPAPEARVRFNWRMPLYAAVGFAAGFGLIGAISMTVYNLAGNAFAVVHPETLVGPWVGAGRGFLVGGLGGAALGFAFKNKMQMLYFAISGAAGFGVAFALVLALDDYTLSSLGWGILDLLGRVGSTSELETSLALGLGPGTLVGAIGGLGLGLGASRGRWVLAPLLCIAGTIWFAYAFAFGDLTFDGHFVSPWDWMAGAIGGAIFGLIVAYVEWYRGKRRVITSGTPGTNTPLPLNTPPSE